MAQTQGLEQLFGLNIVGQIHGSWPEFHKIYQVRKLKSTRSSDYQTYHSAKKVIQEVAVHCDMALVQMFSAFGTSSNVPVTVIIILYPKSQGTDK